MSDNSLGTESEVPNNNPLVTDSTPANYQPTLEPLESSSEPEGVKNENSQEEEVKSKEPYVAMEAEVRRVLRQQSVNPEVRLSPGFKFITRPDLFKFAKVGREWVASISSLPQKI